MLAATGRFDETFVEVFSPAPQVLSYGAMVAHLLTFSADLRLLAVSRLRACGVTDLDFATGDVMGIPGPHHGSS
jgi:AraC family transcriptional regulator